MDGVGSHQGGEGGGQGGEERGGHRRWEGEARWKAGSLEAEALGKCTWRKASKTKQPEGFSDARRELEKPVAERIQR